MSDGTGVGRSTGMFSRSHFFSPCYLLSLALMCFFFSFPKGTLDARI